MLCRSFLVIYVLLCPAGQKGQESEGVKSGAGAVHFTLDPELRIDIAAGQSEYHLARQAER